MLNNQQLAIVNTAQIKMNSFKMTGGKFGKNVIQVNALPGVGKSHTALEIAKTIGDLGYSVLLMAFLTDNAKELNGKFTHENVTISTSHSAGKKSFGYHPKVKTWRIAEYLKKQDAKKQNSIVQLVSLCKANLTNDVEKIAQFYNIQLSSEEMGFCANALANINPKEIDFDDMIFLPVHLDLATPTYDLVILDEAQDQTVSQLELAKRLSKNTVMLLGDENQAIYGFRGAGDYTTIETATQLQLTKTYRFGSVIADYNNNRFGTNIIPAIVKDGKVIDTTHDFMIENLNNDSMVIARTNAELIPIALRAIASGKEIQLTNKKLLNELITMIFSAASDMKHDCGQSMVLLNGKFGEYYKCQDCNKNVSVKKAGKAEIILSSLETMESLRSQIATMKVDATPELMETYNDMIAIFGYLLENNTVQGAIDEVKKLAKSTTGAKLTTGHKAKGDQARFVYVITNRFLEFAQKANSDFWKMQERNLLFVAMTRPEEILYIV